MDYQLLALEKRERFVSIKERIAALHHGEKRKAFLQHLEDAEYALFAFDIERAVAALESAFKLDRDNYELAYFLGETHFNEGETEPALVYFSRVLEVKSDLARPRGQVRPLRGAGLQRGDLLRARRARPRRGLPEARGGDLPRQLPAAVQPRRGLRRPGESRQGGPLPGARGAGRRGAAGAVPARQLLLRDGQADGRRPLPPGRGAPRPGLRGGPSSAGPRLSRPALEPQGARVLPPGAAPEPAEAAVRGSRALPLGPGRRQPAARGRGGGGRLAGEGRGLPEAREPQAGALVLPPGAGARRREPDSPDVLRAALPAPEPQPGDRRR